MQISRPANRLRELRRQRDLKLYDVAALIRRDPATIARWETGETGTIPDHIKLKLAEFYGVSPAYLMGWDEVVHA